MSTKIRTSAPSMSTLEATELVKAERAKRSSKKLAPKVEPKVEPAPQVNPKAKLQALQIRKNGKMSARGLPCLCGCGASTHTMDARFNSGHDAILRRNVLLQGQPLPEIIRPFFEAGEVIAGMRLIEIDGELKIEDVKRGSAGAMAAYAGI